MNESKQLIDVTNNTKLPLIVKQSPGMSQHYTHFFLAPQNEIKLVQFPSTPQLLHFSQEQPKTPVKLASSPRLPSKKSVDNRYSLEFICHKKNVDPKLLDQTAVAKAFAANPPNFS